MPLSRVSLFIPCLVDQVLPEIGLETVRLLERLGYEIDYDPAQTCCGQPAFNAGHREEARSVACHFLEVFEGAECVVCPSGSCTAMARKFIPFVLAGGDREERAVELASRVVELSEFLVREGRVGELEGLAEGRVGFHNSCHSFRELGLVGESLEVLGRVRGCQWVTPPGEPVCCGFGGLFSAKFPAIADAMAHTRLERFAEAGAEILVSNDPGCIQHLRNEAEAKGISIEIVHLIEFLVRSLDRAAEHRGR